MSRPGARSALRMVGDEMYGSSDLSQRPPAGGKALIALLKLIVPTPAKVLVAGPHKEQVLKSLSDAGASVMVLLRSYQDALAIHESDLPASVEVACGSLLKFTPESKFDVVVALDGLERLASVEGGRISWAHALQVLDNMLRPGGHLILSLSNEFGVHRLATGPSTAQLDDGSTGWGSFVKPDRTRPSTLSQLTSHFQMNGLLLSRSFATFPSAEAASILMSTDLLASDSDPQPYLNGAIETVLNDIGSSSPLVVGRAVAMRSAISAGLGAELAPCWTTIASKAQASMEPVPHAIVFEPEAGPLLGASYEITRDDEETWIRRPIEDHIWAKSHPISRNSAALHTPLASRGRLLEDVLLAECALRDTASIRTIVAGYQAWLASLAADGDLAGSAVFAAPDNVIVDAEGRLSCMDPSWDMQTLIPVEVVVARGLLRLVRTMLAGAHVHPWPGATPQRLMIMLASMSGCDIDSETIQQAEALEQQIRKAQRGSMAEVENRAASYHEMATRCEDQREQLRQAHAKLDWYEQMLAARERALRRTQLVVDTLSARWLYGLARSVVRLLRRLNRMTRRLASRNP